ncbi:hypothetical protein TrRE_jg6271, partial [Triparma retinervis]
EAPYGECEKACPTNMKGTRPGATDLDDCFSLQDNFYIVSKHAHRIVVSDNDNAGYSTRRI